MAKNDSAAIKTAIDLIWHDAPALVPLAPIVHPAWRGSAENTVRALRFMAGMGRPYDLFGAPSHLFLNTARAFTSFDYPDTAEGWTEAADHIEALIVVTLVSADPPSAFES